MILGLCSNMMLNTMNVIRTIIRDVEYTKLHFYSWMNASETGVSV